MNKEMIHAAAQLFPTYEHWKNIRELPSYFEEIMALWYVEATIRIRKHFENSLSPEWDYAPWGNTTRDTCWFIREHGPQSLAVRFGWCYSLVLKLEDPHKFNVDAIVRLLGESDYAPLVREFVKNDVRHDVEPIGGRDFRFGTPYDGSFSREDLAWYAAHEIDSFVEQAIAKIEKFTKNPQMTELLRKVNQIAQADASAGKK